MSLSGVSGPKSNIASCTEEKSMKLIAKMFLSVENICWAFAGKSTLVKGRIAMIYSELIMPHIICSEPELFQNNEKDFYIRILIRRLPTNCELTTF
jgi:N12 class adenine-specific DNA methylase